MSTKQSKANEPSQANDVSQNPKKDVRQEGKSAEESSASDTKAAPETKDVKSEGARAEETKGDQAKGANEVRREPLNVGTIKEPRDPRSAVRGRNITREELDDWHYVRVQRSQDPSDPEDPEIAAVEAGYEIDKDRSNQYFAYYRLPRSVYNERIRANSVKSAKRLVAPVANDAADREVGAFRDEASFASETRNVEDILGTDAD